MATRLTTCRSQPARVRAAGRRRAASWRQRWRARAGAQDETLQALIEQNQRREFGQSFDCASRTIHDAEGVAADAVAARPCRRTEQAIRRYEAIVAGGGWPTVPPSERLRLGNRHPSVVALRQRLTVAGDLDANAGVTDILRFLRRGRGAPLPGAPRLHRRRHRARADLRPRSTSRRRCGSRSSRPIWSRLRSLSGHLGNRYVVCNIPAAQIEAVENGVAVSRHTAVVGKPDRPSPDINSKIVEVNFNPYLDRAGLDRAARPHSEDAEGAGLSHQRTASASSTRAATSSRPSRGRRESLDIAARAPSTCQCLAVGGRYAICGLNPGLCPLFGADRVPGARRS